MSDSRLTVVLVILVATGMATGRVALSALFGRVRASRVDTTPYECGIKPFSRVAGNRFSVHFYLVAMLFILFDIEAAFLFPWAATFKHIEASKLFILGEMGVFLGILITGFVYVWTRGALEWD